MITIPLKLLRESGRLPKRSTEGSTGYDLFCAAPYVVLTQRPVGVPTGIALEVPGDCDLQIRPRSGLGLQGIMALFGTVDSDYRGEIMVIMWALEGHHVVEEGDKIAQLVAQPKHTVGFEITSHLSATDRGAGGMGSTGR